jgi:hypothetical protein
MSEGQESPGNACIVVLGMHRSGTSALTGMLSMLGADPGHALMPAHEQVNPKGFWEHEDIVAIHERLLEALKSFWHDERALPDNWPHSPVSLPFRHQIMEVLRSDFAHKSLWIVKDPRMCRLLPLWFHLLRELACHPKFILVLRHPGEVASSLEKRDGLPVELSCLLWLSHMLEAEYQTRGSRRVFVSYSGLLQDWRHTVADIAQCLDIVWPISTDEASSAIEVFLDPSLRHFSSARQLPAHPACQLALKGFELLSEISPDPLQLDRLRTQTAELVKLVGPWSNQLQHCERQVRMLTLFEMESAVLNSEIRRIKSTVSWQITKPLRFVWNMLLRLSPSRRS